MTAPRSNLRLALAPLNNHFFKSERHQFTDGVIQVGNDHGLALYQSSGGGSMTIDFQCKSGKERKGVPAAGGAFDDDAAAERVEYWVFDQIQGKVVVWDNLQDSTVKVMHELGNAERNQLITMNGMRLGAPGDQHAARDRTARILDAIFNSGKPENCARCGGHVEFDQKNCVYACRGEVKACPAKYTTLKPNRVTFHMSPAVQEALSSQAYCDLIIKCGCNRLIQKTGEPFPKRQRTEKSAQPTWKVFSVKGICNCASGIRLTKNSIAAKLALVDLDDDMTPHKLFKLAPSMGFAGVKKSTFLRAVQARYDAEQVEHAAQAPQVLQVAQAAAPAAAAKAAKASKASKTPKTQKIKAAKPKPSKKA